MLQCGPSGDHLGLKRRLNKQELAELATVTRLNETEVKALYARFRRVTSPDTVMTFQQFRTTLGIIGESSGTWLPEAMFRVFCAGEKKLTYDRFIRSLAIMLRGTEDEKLELSFKMATICSSSETRTRTDQPCDDETSDKVMGLPEFENLVRAADHLRRSLVSHPSLEITYERIVHLFDELASKGVMAGGGSGESGGHVVTLEDYKNAARTNQEFLAMLGFQTNFFRGRAGSIVRMTLTSQNSGPITFTQLPAGATLGASGSRTRDDAQLRRKLNDIKGAIRSLQDDCKAMRKPGAVRKANDGQAVMKRPIPMELDDIAVDVDAIDSRHSVSRAGHSDAGRENWSTNERPAPSVSSSMRYAIAGDNELPITGEYDSYTDLIEEKIKLILEQLSDVHIGDEDAFVEYDGSPRTPNARPKRAGTMQYHDGDHTNIGGAIAGKRRSVVSGKDFRQALSKAETAKLLNQSKKKEKSVSKIHRLLGPKKGMAVHFGHENWNMVLNMMVGIRIALGRIANEPRRELHEFDFMNKEKFSIVPRLGNILDSVAGNKIQCTRFVDYSAFVFRKVRELNGINSEDYLRSVGPEQLLGNMILGNLSSLSELSSEGKSGAFFYYTADGNFMIKTVTKQEKDLLRSMLHDYWTHMSNNPNSLLIHFYGLHSLRVKKNGRNANSSTYQKLYFVVMGNMFSTHLDIQRRYDLKGSRVGRSTPQDHRRDETIALRDNDFVDEVNDGTIKAIKLNPATRLALIEQIKRDTAFLEHKNIIDYSLLLGLHTFEKGGREEYMLDLEEMVPADCLGGVHPDDAATHTAAEESAMLDEWKKRQEFRNGIFSLEDDSEEDGTVYFLGMIDILTYYGNFKKFEHRFKSIQHPAQRKEISCAPPDSYASRFVNFIEKEVFKETT